MALQLTVLSLNIWGIPFISKNRNERMLAIGKELSRGKYDIVSLQEVWTENDNQLLQKLTKAALPYAHYFYSGVFGSGLLVLSRFPIVSALFHAWSVNGYFHRIQHADWYGGKGVGFCRIRISPDQYIHLYNAHLHAEYDGKNDDYKTHRIIQAFDTAEFIEATRGDAIIQILAGDLNTQPHDIAYNILLKTAKLSDACSSDVITTYQHPKNSYTSKRQEIAGQRIDHILYRNRQQIKATIVEFSLPFPDIVPETNHSFSDHEAIMVKLTLESGLTIKNSNDIDGSGGDILRMDSKTKNNLISMLNGGGKTFNADKSVQCRAGLDYTLMNSVIEDAIIICNNHLKTLKRSRMLYCMGAVLLISVMFLLFVIPNNYIILYYSLKLSFFMAFLYCVFMAVLWNPIERHGILSGLKSMETKLSNFNTHSVHG